VLAVYVNDWQAHRVCVKVGQMWRAATLDGWRLYHDPNLESLGPAGSVLKVHGNRNRDIWKSACWKLSEDVGSTCVRYCSVISVMV